MTRHGLRATVIKNLFQMGNDALALSLRSDHAQLESARGYVNLKAVLGKHQQSDILPDLDEQAKSHKSHEFKQQPTTFSANAVQPS